MEDIGSTSCVCVLSGDKGRDDDSLPTQPRAARPAGNCLGPPDRLAVPALARLWLNAPHFTIDSWSNRLSLTPFRDLTWADFLPIRLNSLTNFDSLSFILYSARLLPRLESEIVVENRHRCLGDESDDLHVLSR